MLRSFLPFLLASLGIVLVVVVPNMALFEWQISEIVTDFPPEVHINPPPWTTKLGESLEDESYVFYQVTISSGGISCHPEDPHFVVKRSKNDETLERVALNVSQKIISWLSKWYLTGLVLFLCGIYIWWFTIYYDRPISETIVFTIAAVVLSCFVTQALRTLLTKIGLGPGCSAMGVYYPYDVTATINARLSKIHYETLMVLSAAILAEVGALGIILCQIIKAVVERKESAKSAVG